MPQREASNAYERKQKANGMIRRDQSAAISANGLLSKQFASITEVLLKASQRRDQDLQQRPSRPVPNSTTFRPVSKPLVAAEPEPSQVNAFGDDHIGLEQVKQSNKNIVGIKLMTAGTDERHSDMSETQTSLRGCDVPEYADNPKMILAELKSSSPEHSGHDVIEELDDSYGQKNTRVDMKCVSSLMKGAAVEHVSDAKDKPTSPSIDEADALSILAKRLGIDSNESKAFENIGSTFDELDERFSNASHTEDKDNDLKALREEIAAVFSPPCDTTARDFQRTTRDTPVNSMRSNPQEHAVGNLQPDDTPPVAVVILELGDAECKDVQVGCTLPFNDGIDEQETQRKKETMLERENEKLEATIKYVLEEEKRYRAIEENKRLKTRLIVSNLAADVDDKAIRAFFAKYVTEIRNVNILSVRDPVKRTRTAYVDMYSRKVAVRASYEVGGIFGLIVKIKLAVE
ncbi:hypothetical protein AG0111_0g10775 [Alternaria gaisen]|uniref:Uncharacterized protein n=1 Tax=Alternaria gaisen TaxID=167740 RepID=A0ACB6F918_9PLEO|nr:hypothetical protein AG0111_0g10775 [Alternaria gaisen]